MSRSALWAQLRAAVAAGDTDAANKTAKALGYINTAMRRRLLDRLWHQARKEGRLES